MIEWQQCDLIDIESDLCSRYNGKYVDVVRSYKGTWSAFYNNDRIVEDLPTREMAIQFLQDYLRN